ncbi:MAG: exodeoxyribonuclease V subunit beta [Litorilituus sp.]|jgi:exodeoxyribonuclease V beta subunit|nr:exodeoxyribonuclease V subunit beta [Litorilituus sp.]
MNLANLNAADIPLTGKHLIEASAGTGKTYNITRIYLRLLLERELPVEDILLMTFTKDATYELRGRIDSFIRDALCNWHQLCKKDIYFQAINKRVGFKKVELLLKRALLFLDEAAIYTIHGFCQRAIAQHAFASGLPFNANLTTNNAEFILEACQDWYRQLAKESRENFELIVKFWATPDKFILSFNKAIHQQSQLSTIDSGALVNNFIQLAKQAHKTLVDNQGLLQEGLITHKKAQEQALRGQELTRLLSWLEQVGLSVDAASLLVVTTTPIPDYLLNGNRHPKTFKAQLATVLAGCKAIKVKQNHLAKQINQANAYQIVRSAIYQIREQVKAKKAQLNLLDFDDLISTLATSLALQPKKQDEALSTTLLKQFPVALVDEFQDTDTKQFSILQSIYYSEQAREHDAALYLIGDPKQAIYGFRGGDIFAYLTARHGCDHHWLMDTNYRSTPDMVNAYNQVFLSKKAQSEDAVFGYGIPYQAVKAGKNQSVELAYNTAQQSTCDSNKALQFIHFTADNTTSDEVSQHYACPLIATWCANEIVRLLDEKRCKSQDIAILVRDTREANYIKQALQAANLASVFLSDRANLFHSEQAKQLLTLLKGVLSIEDEHQYLAALTCGLLGYNATKLYQLQHDEIAYQQLKMAFNDYKNQWQHQGFIAMAITLMHQQFQLPMEGKDRALTNILHLFEILQSASQRFLQPQELIHWFERQCNQENANAELEAEQRLENDGNLIRIITQHGSKGLEYPVVFIPFASKHKDPLKFARQNVSYLEYHDEQGNLCLSLGGDEQAKIAMANEVYAETIRLLYVAITRAVQHCYIFIAPFEKYHLSPLGKTLQWQAQEDIQRGIQSLLVRAEQAIGYKEQCLEEITPRLATEPVVDSAGTLTVSQFTAHIERDWWLSSFSALTRNLRHGDISNPDRDMIETPEHLAHSLSRHDTSLLRFTLTKGAHSGNLLHDILEHTDFSDPNWLETIKWPLVKYGELTKPYTQDDLIVWLEQVLFTPLLIENSTSKDTTVFYLAKLVLSKTIRESEFYFPMQADNSEALAKLLTDHRNSPVTLPRYQSLKGMMHGFIDLIFEYEGKYYVCDYKSSHLGEHYCDYNHEAMKANIEKNYYDLQYLIYSLALHRYLQLNLPGYQVTQHFGGVFYLYLRGMTTDRAHQGAGVYYRKITTVELAELDALFAGQSITAEVLS